MPRPTLRKSPIYLPSPLGRHTPVPLTTSQLWPYPLTQRTHSLAPNIQHVASSERHDRPQALGLSTSPGKADFWIANVKTPLVHPGTSSRVP